MIQTSFNWTVFAGALVLYYLDIVFEFISEGMLFICLWIVDVCSGTSHVNLFLQSMFWGFDDLIYFRCALWGDLNYSSDLVDFITISLQFFTDLRIRSGI